MELCMCEKAVSFIPVNILAVWSPAFLAARHTTVCLDTLAELLIHGEHFKPNFNVTDQCKRKLWLQMYALVVYFQHNRCTNQISCSFCCLAL